MWVESAGWFRLTALLLIAACATLDEVTALERQAPFPPVVAAQPPQDPPDEATTEPAEPAVAAEPTEPAEPAVEAEPTDAAPGEAEPDDELPEWLRTLEITGYAFGDVYSFVEHPDPDVEGQNGFWFRRIYLTFDSELSDSLSARLRFEMNSPGDFSESTTLDPFVKSAYLRWDHSNESLYLGISDTPTFDLIDDVWGYRSVEKSPIDLHRLGPSADFGVALRGAVGRDQRFTYHAMLANGSGTRGEVDSGKKGMLAAAFHPTERLTIEAYGDVESRPGSTDRHTSQLFVAYQSEPMRIGVQAARQHQEIATGGSRDIDLVSAFGVFDLAESVALLVRYDRVFDPNPEGARIPYLPFDPSAASQLVILGVELSLHDKLDLIPNVEAIFHDHDDGRAGPDDALVPRLTFFWRL